MIVDHDLRAVNGGHLGIHAHHLLRDWSRASELRAIILDPHDLASVDRVGPAEALRKAADRGHLGHDRPNPGIGRSENHRMAAR
jgi:hypothetical protein